VGGSKEETEGSSKVSNLYSLHQSEFDYEGGAKIAFSLRIDRKKLAQLVWKAAKNKNGKSIAGPLTIEAKKLHEGAIKY